MGRRGTWLTWGVLISIWGTTWLAIKVGLQDLPPFTFAGVRFIVAIVPIAAYVWLGRRPVRLTRGDWGLLTVTGLLTFTAGYGLVFWGEQYISSGLTAVLYTTYPLLGMVFAHFLLPAEPFSLRKGLGAALGVVGVAIIYTDQLRLEGGHAAMGCAAVLVSAVAGTFSGVLIKRHGGHLRPEVITLVQMIIGGAPLIALGLVLEGNPLHVAWTAKAVACLLYLALAGTSLAFVLWYRLLQAIPVTRAQVMPVLNTLVAVGAGWLVLHEHYGVQALAGIAAVLFGLVLALAGKRDAKINIRREESCGST